jgi:hypothetical protein
MTTNRYQLITPPDLENYANIANDIAGVAWPEVMLHNPIADEYWHELFDRFEEYQFALMDQESNQMAAMGNRVPFHWDKPLEELREGGWDWVFAKAVEDKMRAFMSNPMFGFNTCSPTTKFVTSRLNAR